MPHIRFGKHKINVPGSQIVRVTVGVLFIIGGLLGFLPVVGFWMLPLGILLLSYDFPLIRRVRRRFEVTAGRWLQRFRRWRRRRT